MFNQRDSGSYSYLNRFFNQNQDQRSNYGVSDHAQSYENIERTPRKSYWNENLNQTTSGEGNYNTFLNSNTQNIQSSRHRSRSSDAPKIYTPEDTVAFGQQIDRLQIHETYKQTLKNTHKDLIDIIEQLKLNNESLKKNETVYERDLAASTAATEMLTTELTMLKAEMQNLTVENERIAMADNQEKTEFKRVSKELGENKTKLITLTKEVDLCKKLSQKATFELNTCKITNLEQENKISDLETENLTLIKTLDLQDHTIAKKLMQYDERFESMKREHDKVHEVYKNVDILYNSISSNQASQLTDFYKVYDIVNNLEKRTTSMQELMTNTYETSVVSIKNDLKDIEEIISTDLLKEVKEMKETRENIKTEHNQMTTVFNNFKDTFVPKWDSVLEKLNLLDQITSDKFKEFTPYLVAVAIIFLFIGKYWFN